METRLSRFCDGLMEAGWIAAIIAVPLFFNIHSDRVFEPDKLTLLRSIAMVMSIAWLVKFIDLSGWERSSWLNWRDKESIWRMPFVLPVALLVVVYLISTAISVSPRVSWAGSYQRLQGTYTTLSYIIVFALAVSTIRTRAQVSRVVTAVIVTSIPVSFYGLLQHFNRDPLPWGGDTARRIAGHMGNAIFIAAYLIMALPLTLARIIDAFTSILADEELSYADVIRSSVYIFTLAIQLVAIYWSFSRGPWMGLLVAVYAFMLIMLVTLRDAAPEQGRLRFGEIGKGFLFIFIGVPFLYAFFYFTLQGFLNIGRFLVWQERPFHTFVAFAAAILFTVLIVFIMLAIRRGWRWLWISWLSLAAILATWLVLFNFAEDLTETFADTPVASEVIEVLLEWQDIPGIGRLGLIF